MNRKRIVAGVRFALQLSPPGRNLAVREDDVFLVSYPKSGNTWTRFLLANLVYSEKSPSFANIDQLIPDPGVLSKRDFERLPSPRFIRTHSWFDPSFKRVIYIVRDPRDIAVSQFHYHKKRGVLPAGSTIQQFIDRFLVGATVPHGSWKENVASWIGARFGQPGFLLLRYEDMLSDTHREVTRIAKFLKIGATPDGIASAVERSSADRMRQLEQADGADCALLKGTRRDLPFVRNAKSGNWNTELPTECVAKMEEKWGDWMLRLGYNLSTKSSASILPNDYLHSKDPD